MGTHPPPLLQTYVQSLSEQPLVTGGRLPGLLVPPADDMRDCCRVRVCSSADAQGVGSRVYDHHIVALYMLHNKTQRDY